jgi:hypothetical protein
VATRIGSILFAAGWAKWRIGITPGSEEHFFTFSI